MKGQFVPYEIAIKLQEKGFDWHCLAVYMNGEFQIPRGFGMAIVTTEHVDILKGKAILAPLWQQVIDWLKSKGILITELWDGWEYAKLEEDFTWVQTKEQAIEYALTLI